MPREWQSLVRVSYRPTIQLTDGDTSMTPELPSGVAGRHSVQRLLGCQCVMALSSIFSSS